MAHRPLLALDRLEKVALVVHVLDLAVPAERPLGHLVAPLLQVGQPRAAQALQVVVLHVLEPVQLVVEPRLYARGHLHDGLLEGCVGGGHGCWGLVSLC